MLVPLEVHRRLGKAKIAKEILSDVGMGRALYRWKAKEKSFSNKLKNMSIGYLVREIRPREVTRLKVNSRECPEATPTTQGGGGGSCRGLQKHMYGRWGLILRLGCCESPSGS